MANKETKLVIITSMSGAGKTVAIQSIEDLGYYCVDNLPPTLLPKFLELMKDSANTISKVALVVDLRGREFFNALYDSLDTLGYEDWLEEHILFLNASDEVLVSRYKETRRSHPLSDGGLPLDGIMQEREILNELRGRAQKIIDTSELKPKELREQIIELYANDNEILFSTHFVSIGFNNGVPIDANIMVDARCLPTPPTIESMKPLTGLHPDVSSYAFKWSDTKTFNEKLIDLLKFVLPPYKKEGKSHLVIAIGCTRGQHRSVAL